MKCTFCGFVFNEKAAGVACRACPMSRGCDMIRCPNCGFELPVEPDWLRKLINMLKGRKHDPDRKSGRDS